MRKGDRAELKAKKALWIKENLASQIYVCKVLKHDEKQECIYLSFEEGNLSDLSLDCIYECTVYSEKTLIKCTGRMKERYCGKDGNTVKFLIENGFYKINIKSVDKQIV